MTRHLFKPGHLNNAPLINDDSGQNSSVVVEGEKLGEKALMANQHNPHSASRVEQGHGMSPSGTNTGRECKREIRTSDSMQIA
jgi:hypothetical protein